MQTSRKRVLLNAEPFGFGPTAAIAAFFPYLREQLPYLAYVGKGLTLDLQSPLGYDRIYDLDQTESLDAIFAEHDVFVTALDFELAARAKQAGLAVVIYDPLTWYWKELHSAIGASDAYIAQDFFGVRERIAQDAGFFRNAQVVAPIVPKEEPVCAPQATLLNMGGLQNPVWQPVDASTYAKRMAHAVRTVVPSDTPLEITTSTGIIEQLGDAHMRSYNRAAMMQVLSRTACAFMTPGLGNIYDAAYYGIPTAWLPPANDSQGQQLQLLADNGYADAVIDWVDLGVGSIDYRADQAATLAHIAEAVQRFDEARAAAACSSAYATIHVPGIGKSRGLLDRFGRGGAEQTATIILEHA